MQIRAHTLTFPLNETNARQLCAGDQVLINGEIVITAGLPTHERLLRCLDGKDVMPMDLHGRTLFHLGCLNREIDGRFELRYLNPTTSTRFNPFMPRLIDGLRLHAVGGKGGLDQASVDAMQRIGTVYLAFLGGGCTLLSRAVHEVLQVGWSDMLMHYRLVRLRVEGLGPATVAIDAHGCSLYAETQRTAQASLPALMQGLDASRNASTAQKVPSPIC